MDNYKHFYHPKSLENYNFYERICSYRTEKLEISPEELKKIKQTPKSQVKIKKTEENVQKTKIIIDTDIGTDLDDALALLYALNLPQAEILGVTTNYGPSKLRSSIVKFILNAHYRLHPEYSIIPVVAGASCQIGTHRPVFIHGNEGKPFFNNDEMTEFLDYDLWNTWNQTDAADFLISSILQFPNEIKIVSIGIPTNIALALKRNPEISNLIKEIVVMGGGNYMTSPNCDNHFFKYDLDSKSWNNPKKVDPPFGLPKPDQVIDWITKGNIIHLYPNHNLSGDTMASKCLFSFINIQIKIIPHDITRQFWLEGVSIDFLRSNKESLSINDFSTTDNPHGIVGWLMCEWFKRRYGQNGQCPHDPLTIHEALFGGNDSPIFYVNGTYIVHEWAAYSTFIPNENGKHLLGIQVENSEFFLKFLETTLMKK